MVPPVLSLPPPVSPVRTAGGKALFENLYIPPLPPGVKPLNSFASVQSSMQEITATEDSKAANAKYVACCVRVNNFVTLCYPDSVHTAIWLAKQVPTISRQKVFVMHVRFFKHYSRVEREATTNNRERLDKVYPASRTFVSRLSPFFALLTYSGKLGFKPIPMFPDLWRNHYERVCNFTRS